MEPSRTEPPSVSDEILTVQEVADYLKVTTKTVYELIRQGSLPSFRIGRAVRCRRVALEDFIEQRLSEDEQAAATAHQSQAVPRENA